MTEVEVGGVFVIIGVLGILFTILGWLLSDSHEIDCLRKRIKRLED